VRAALDPKGPLRRFVAAAKDHFVLRDRGELLEGLAGLQRRADERWAALRAPLRGLCKLPWVEGAAVSGGLALGVLRSDDEALRLWVVAEGGRAAAAAAAIRAFRRARPGAARLWTLDALLDADSLALPAGGAAAALRLVSLRPLANAAAFAELLAANPWAGRQFPNHSLEAPPGLPEFELGPRLDGRFAGLRRLALGLSAAEVGHGDQRTRGAAAELERRLLEGLGLTGDRSDAPPALPSDDPWRARWREMEAWELDDGRPESKRAPTAPEVPAASAAPPAAPPPIATVPSRGPRRAPRRLARAAPSAAQAVTGRRSHGAGRRRGAVRGESEQEIG
jgi:hypothetical protein